MAIFRGGKRIGPFDIRMGFPRDKSLDNVDQDPRLRQHANTENTIGRFRATMGRAEGYARAARYAVRIWAPSGLAKMAGLTVQDGPPGTKPRSISPAVPTGANMIELEKMIGQQLNIHCDSVVMPGHDLQGEDVKYFGPGRKIVTGHEYQGSITCSFYADKYLRERHFLEMWQKLAVDPLSHKAGYYDDYVGKMHIYQLGSLDGAGDRDYPTYGIEAVEVYPETIGAITYAYGSASTLTKISCDFQYRMWHNLATDKIGGMEFASGAQTLHKVKGRSGFFDKLPPELKRAGRDFINQAKTQLPIGRLTKGKIFPPFT